MDDLARFTTVQAEGSNLLLSWDTVSLFGGL